MLCAKYQLHLTLLRRFCSLYDAVEALAVDGETKASLVQQFLVCAEFRYLRYLALLDGFASELHRSYSDGERVFKEMMPLPPWSACAKLG
jgi:hypothetical protein